MSSVHSYDLSVHWTGNRGSGTSAYRAYGRDHEVTAPGKPPLAGSSDPAFRGDADRWNPEELLVAALSSCHLLWYLHLAAVAGVVVTDYTDQATGTLAEDPDGGSRFGRVVLRPTVTVAEAAMQSRAQALHEEAARKCFIARSVNFPVEHRPTTRVVGAL